MMNPEHGGWTDEPLPIDELDWLAWQFVAGDLDESHSLAWLQRLDRDPAAVQAVERAIELFELGQAAVRQLSGGRTRPDLPATISSASILANEAGWLAARGPQAEKVTLPSPAQRDRRWGPRPAFQAIAASLLALVAGIRLTTHWMQLKQNERMVATLWSEQYADAEHLTDQLAWDDVETCADDLACAETEDRLAGEASDEDDWILGAALSLEGMLDDDGKPIVF